MMRTLSLMLATVAALAGCSGGNETSDTQSGQIETILRAARSAAQSKPAPLPQLTPQLIDSLTVGALEITVENRGATAFLAPFSDRTDGRPGALRTWRTADKALFVLRDGVLVTTRGLGNDLGSSNAQTTVQAVRTRAPVSGAKQLYVRTGDNGTQRIDLNCRMQSLGTQNLTIVGTTRSVVQLRETCTGWTDPVVNDYWVARSDGAVWQSRQWAGPGLGYIRTRLLKK